MMVVRDRQLFDLQTWIVVRLTYTKLQLTVVLVTDLIYRQCSFINPQTVKRMIGFKIDPL